MTTKHEIKDTIGSSAPRAPDVDPRQSVAPDPGGPVMTYEERRAAIRALLAQDAEEQNPRTPEETEAIIDAHMAREHLPGPIPEGKQFCVQCHDADGKACGEPSEPMTHAEAIEECNMRNISELDERGCWWGVTHLPVEAK